MRANTNYEGKGLKMNYNGVIFDVIKTTTKNVVLSYLNIQVIIDVKNATKVFS